MSYRAPIEDYVFLFTHALGNNGLNEMFSEFGLDTDDVREILAGAGKLAENILSPLQRNGDQQPARLENGIVRTSPGFMEGYRSISDGGWISMSASTDYGGMGLPISLQSAVNEMVNGSCISLGLNPLLTQGLIETLEAHADRKIKAAYLPKLVSGEWAGTMNITEPQAGSDVGAIRTVAVPGNSEAYLVSGQKIFISWADSDLVKNICHLVLARLPGGGKGSKGLSLFLVPKFIPDETGNPGRRNSVKVVSLERKLGLHGSPTATMQFENATGWLVGNPHEGLKSMFTMMNSARLGVGCQGVGVASYAFNLALDYARSRVQGRGPRKGGAETIIAHAPVRQVLAEMHGKIFAARSICAACAYAIDMSRLTGDSKWLDRAGLLTPIAKAFGSDMGVEVSLLGIQAQGGTGYIEDSGAGQCLRDVLVTTIYEGTNGIQAIDLAGRKLSDGGRAAEELLSELRVNSEDIGRNDREMGEMLLSAVSRMRSTTIVMSSNGDLNNRFANASSYLRAFALLLGASFHSAALGEAPGAKSRAVAARIFIRRNLPEVHRLCELAEQGDEELYSIDFDSFDR